MSRQTHNANIAVRAELAAKQEEVQALTADLRASAKENQRLEGELKNTQVVFKDLERAVAKSAEQLEEFRKKYEKLDNSLVDELKGVPGVVIDKKGAIHVGGPLFEFAKAGLKAESAKSLGKVAAALAKRKGMIYVDGHTDNIPVGHPETKKLYTDNLGLSLARAAAVARGLIRAKVPATRIIVRGFGDARPVASNKTREGRAKNRRVEIRLVPPEGDKKK